MHTQDNAIRGRLKALSIADVLVFLRSLNRSGRLTVRRDPDEVALDLRGPFVVRASSSRPADRLDEVLLLSGRITLVEHAEARRREAQDPESGIGRALIAAGALTPRELVAARREQARHVVLSLFEWTEGDYAFEDGRALSGWSTPVDLPILDLVADGVRRLRSTGLFLERLPSPDWVFERGDSGPGMQVALEPHEAQVLALLDGNLSVEEIEERCEFPAGETRRILFLLLTIGRARPRTVARDRAAGGAEEAEEIVRRFNGLFGRVHQYLMIEMGPIVTDLLQAAVRALEREEGELFREVALAGDGTLDADRLRRNLLALPRPARRAALVQGLNELLYRELLVLRQSLGTDHERRLLGQLRREGLLGTLPAAPEEAPAARALDERPPAARAS